MTGITVLGAFAAIYQAFCATIQAVEPAQRLARKVTAIIRQITASDETAPIVAIHPLDKPLSVMAERAFKEAPFETHLIPKVSANFRTNEEEELPEEVATIKIATLQPYYMNSSKVSDAEVEAETHSFAIEAEVESTAPQSATITLPIKKKHHLRNFQRWMASKESWQKRITEDREAQY